MELSPCVTYRGPDGREHRHALGTGPVTVGRSSAADICLAWDPEVSRVHARLELVGDDPANDWTVVDDGSSRNGTYVNAQRIRGRAHLHDGDGLSVGQTLLVFRLAATEARGADTGVHEVGLESHATTVGLPHVTRESLSDTQRRILIALAGNGSEPVSDETVAAALFLNPATVRAHLLMLYERFGVAALPPEQRRTALVTLARAGGLLVERER
jgi:pSer/pThr/pTyr-binding forkhead associated (FHA) protein